MIKTVLLDLDNTLLDFYRAEEAAILGTLQDMHIDPKPGIAARYSAINAGQWALIEQGQTTRERALVRRFELLLEELGADRSAAEMKNIYEKRLACGHFFMPGAPELLEALYPVYDLYLASNGTTAVQQGRLKSAGISHYFKEIFLSQQLGANKPDPAFFERCFEKIPGFRRENTVIVGDSLTSDIQGGMSAGIHTCWFNRDGIPGRSSIVPEAEISELGELPALLAGM